MTDHPPTYPLWIRDRRPWDSSVWLKFNGYRHDGLLDGIHSGGVWLHTRTQEVWKPLDGKPFANAEVHVTTNEDTCLEALAGRPGFPRNWRIETHTQTNGSESIERRYLVRPKCVVLDKDGITLDMALAVERAVRGMNQAGWLLNDPVSVACDPWTGEPFILDLSVAAFTTVQEPWAWGHNDLYRIPKWLDWAGQAELVSLRDAGRKAVLDLLCQSADDTWPGREWEHVYVDPGDFTPDRAHYVEPFIIVPEPLGDDVMDEHNLTWAWSPLIFDAEPATATPWWERKETCKQLSMF